MSNAQEVRSCAPCWRPGSSHAAPGGAQAMHAAPKQHPSSEASSTDTASKQLPCARFGDLFGANIWVSSAN
eukprot:6389607-Lingulodinium_polyedra.AAC.2